MRLSLAIAALAALIAVPARADEPIKVMIVGMVHLNNPGQDEMNISVDDVLTGKRQAEIAAVNEGLARFAPTKIAVEWPQDITAERYARYLAGTLEPSRNEVVQIGFRLAKTMGHGKVFAIDADGDWPFDTVEAYAKAHGQTAYIDAAMADLRDMVAATQKIVDTGTIGAVLRQANEPTRFAADNGFYRGLLRVGGGAEQPGALLLAAWQKRNDLICANLVQLAKSGDRIVVLFGSGHGFLLRQCVSEMPGFELVEPADYLPE